MGWRALHRKHRSSQLNLKVRVKLSDWLKRRERPWALPSRRNVTPVSHTIYRQTSRRSHLDLM